MPYVEISVLPSALHLVPATKPSVGFSQNSVLEFFAKSYRASVSFVQWPG